MKQIPFRFKAAWSYLLPAILAGAAVAAAETPTQPKQGGAPVAKQIKVDELLTRPYDADVPMGCVGARMWASSPQGWAFRDDVHWLYLTNLRAYDLEVRDAKGLIVPGKGTYFPSHVHMHSPTRTDLATASFTYAADQVHNPLTRPFVPHKRWTCWSSGQREDWFAVEFSNARPLNGLKAYFFSDAPRGGCREPESVKIEVRKDGNWTTVAIKNQLPAKPAKGENSFEFDSVNAEAIKLTFKNAGKDFYTGLYGFEPIYSDANVKTEIAEVAVGIETKKFITEDDVLITLVEVRNPTTTEQTVNVRIASPLVWPNNQVSKATAIRAGDNFKLDLSGGTTTLHNQNVFYHLYSNIQSQGKLGVDNSPGGPSLKFTVAPASQITMQVAMAFADTAQAAKTLAYSRPIEPLENHVRTYQKWFDDNVAHFDCSDPLITKMYYHRAYNLLKNSMDPKLGKLQWKTFVEGRWRSRWYSNVITYGGGHQVREARWLRDKSYWQGHLQTYANNPKANGVYPGHVTPAGPSDSQYTDWISSTAWDGNLVHPDKKFLEEIADKLAINVRGWQKVYDPDGDGLLLVDSHWWTGMEWQPSFFAFCNYKTNPKDRLNPKEVVSLDRVDLTAYNFGNANNLAKVYHEINKPEKAKEFEALADKIRSAMLKKMWDGEAKFFYSLRHGDGRKADVKEIIGVYPFYFGMVPAKVGYEKTWESIIDRDQFWTKWPLASSTKQNAAYSQEGWPTDQGGTGCMWNGPTWPHANSLVMTAMARSIRDSRALGAESPLTADHLWELFDSFTKAQYKDQDPNYPWTGEFYHGETAKWKTGERDYNHSTWIDVLIPDLIGLSPRNDDTLKIDPLIPAGKLRFFQLADQSYHGKSVTIVWDDPVDAEDRYEDGRKGFDVYVDGKLVGSANAIGPMSIKMP